MPQRDGSLLLPRGVELVLTGLDVGYGLAPISEAFMDEVHALAATDGPWRVVGAGYDRHGRLLGRVETPYGVWVQERLLRLGLARFAGGVAGRAEKQALLAAEHAARTERRGVWRNPRYYVRSADDPAGIYNGFQIVEGRVTAIGRSDGTVFLNFGTDWRDDFTAGIAARLDPGDLPESKDGAPLTVFDLEGRVLRLRGVVRRYNGPYMEIASGDQIELLPDGNADPVTFRSSGPSDPRPASGSTL